MGWAATEFKNVNLGDKRLNKRLINLCERFSNSPESPINQACVDWAETKAAYRFFQNNQVNTEEIISSHRHRTEIRASEYSTILALQDTSYCIYTNHSKTQGLGQLSMKRGKNIDKIYSTGLVMHTCLAVTTDGAPLGLLDQNIYSRTLRPENQRKSSSGRQIQDYLPVEEKETYRWIKALESSSNLSNKTQIVTVCDRECDFYDFFQSAKLLDAPVLVRASQNRTVNRNSRYAEVGVEKLWSLISSQTSKGEYTIDVIGKEKSRHCKGRKARTAIMDIKITAFKMNPPRNHPKHKSKDLDDIQLYAIQALERNPPKEEEPLEWMLLTNQEISNFSDASERIKWYALRWRIEMYFKVLKSGLKIESCRLGTSDRLSRYLVVMSIVAWRIFAITLIARSTPSRPCSSILSKKEWKVLSILNNKENEFSKNTPSVSQVVIWIAKLGGYLDRGCDGPPGTIALWRGYKRLSDITCGWNIALSNKTCG